MEKDKQAIIRAVEEFGGEAKLVGSLRHKCASSLFGDLDMFIRLNVGMSLGITTHAELSIKDLHELSSRLPQSYQLTTNNKQGGIICKVRNDETGNNLELTFISSLSFDQDDSSQLAIQAWNISHTKEKLWMTVRNYFYLFFII